MFADHLIQYRILPMPKTAEKHGFCTGVTDRQTDRPTNRRTDGRTDRPSYRDARMYLKTDKWSTKGLEMRTQKNMHRKRRLPFTTFFRSARAAFIGKALSNRPESWFRWRWRSSHPQEAVRSSPQPSPKESQKQFYVSLYCVICRGRGEEGPLFSLMRLCFIHWYNWCTIWVEYDSNFCW